jgi:hypothetical protein
MNCTKCSATLDLSLATCSTCGAAIDSDGDGLPDAIAALIEKKARAIVAEEKEREAAEAARRAADEAARQAEHAAREAEEAAKADLLQTNEQLASTRADLERNERQPRPLWVVSRMRMLLLLVVSFVGSCFVSCGAETLAGRSVFAGSVFCPHVCDGCRGPGRIFTWHQSTNNQDDSVYIQLCHNPRESIDGLSHGDLFLRQDELKNAPYEMSGYVNLLANTVALFGLLCVPAPFFFGRLRRVLLRNERAALLKQEKALVAKLAATTGVPERTEPYR